MNGRPEAVAIPDDKIMVPGVIDTNTNHVEHPQLVAQRICAHAALVGRERVMAGTDCGFGTFAGRVQVDWKIVWMKLSSLAEGARLASKQIVDEGGIVLSVSRMRCSA